MRVLLDENLDHRLAREFAPGFAVESVRSRGWQGMKNGRLLAAAQEAGFEAFVTMDHALQHQQNIPASELRMIVVRAPSNRLADVRPLLRRVEIALRAASPGTVTAVGREGVAFPDA